jgi:uncharacterized heparinase superfamily protein
MAEHGAMWRGEHPSQQLKPLGLLGFAHRIWPHHSLKANAFSQPITSLIKGNESEAFAMYAGHFNFEGESITTTAAQIFNTPSGSKAFQRQLHRLDWLKHFAASNRALHAHYALRLLGRWAKSNLKFDRAEDLSQVVVALASDGQSLARRCEAQLQSEFLDIASPLIRKLMNKSTHNAEAAVAKAIAILYAVTTFKGFEELRKSAAELLSSNIDKLILADGGHSSYQAQPLIALIAQLLPLQSALQAQRQALPQAAVHAIDRMLPMLRMLSFGNHHLTTLRGPYQNPNLVKTLLAHGDARPLQQASNSRLVRIEAVALTLIVDTQDHFALELAIGQNPIFKNAVITAPSKHPQGRIRNQAEGHVLHMVDADGFGRINYVSTDGTDIRVEDYHPMPFQIVFDVTPDVKLSALRDGAAILFVMPDRHVWQLSLRGAKAMLESGGGISITCEAGARINWALKKQHPASKSQSRKSKPASNLLV